MPENRPIETVIDELKNKVSEINALIEEAKNLKFEVRLWSENQQNGKNIRMKVLNVNPVLEL